MDKDEIKKKTCDLCDKPLNDYHDRIYYVYLDNIQFRTCNECAWRVSEKICKRGGQPKVSVTERFGGPVQLWDVYTQGDCEGKSTKIIATEYGHIADLALKYRNHREYTIKFQVHEPEPKEDDPEEADVNEGDQVEIELGINAGLKNANHKEKAIAINKWMKRDDIAINAFGNYGGVIIRKK